MPVQVQALEARFFDTTTYEHEISPWLNSVETKLNRSGLTSIDASFLLLIDKQGRVTNLELDDIQVEPVVLRDFISKLASIKFEAGPLMLANTRILLDAKTLTISRNEELEQHSDALVTDLTDWLPVDLLSQQNTVNLSQQANLTTNTKLNHKFIHEATLISPEFFSAVRVGDSISFELGSQKYIGRVIDSGREIIIATDALLVADEIQADTLQYWRLEEEHEDKGTWDAMFSGASAGLSLGLASHGIATLAFAGLAALGSRMQDRDFSLNAGDKFYIRKLDFVTSHKGVKICKQ